MFDTRERFSGRHASSGAGLLAMLGEARGLLKEAGARLDPDALDDPTVVRAVHDELVAIGKLVDGARMRLARRIHQTNAWKGSGDASAAAYLARTAGTTGAAARDLLDTSMRLPDAPATDAAARRGQVSTGQAHAITDAAHSDAAAEAGLLARAAATPLSGLREEARRVKAAADPNPEATARRVHRNRRVRRWNDAEGAYNLHLRTTALAGAHIDATVQPLLDHLFTVARRQGRREPIDAYAADALTALITGHHPTTPHPEPDERAAAGEPAAGEPAPDDGSDPHTSTAPTGRDGHDGHDGDRRDGNVSGDGDTPSKTGAARPPTPGTDGHSSGNSSAANAPRGQGAPLCADPRHATSRARETKVIIHVDGAALRRGRTLPGERCHIDGVGPLPVAAVAQQLPHAFVAVVIKDATAVWSVSHPGRAPTARQTTGMQARGYHCEVPSCGARHRLEKDHISGWTNTHTTRLDDLANRQYAWSGGCAEGSTVQRPWTNQSSPVRLVPWPTSSRVLRNRR